jgi:hypothetical protein
VGKTTPNNDMHRSRRSRVRADTGETVRRPSDVCSLDALELHRYDKLWIERADGLFTSPIIKISNAPNECQSQAISSFFIRSLAWRRWGFAPFDRMRC